MKDRYEAKPGINDHVERQVLSKDPAGVLSPCFWPAGDLEASSERSEDYIKNLGLRTGMDTGY